MALHRALEIHLDVCVSVLSRVGVLCNGDGDFEFRGESSPLSQLDAIRGEQFSVDFFEGHFERTTQKFTNRSSSEVNPKIDAYATLEWIGTFY